MQSNNFEFVDAGLNSPPFNKIPSFSNISSLDLQKKLPDIPNAQKANQTLRFDTTQIRFFVDKAKTVSIIPNKNKPMKESSKQIVKNSVKGESEKNAFERISEKLSEKQSSSKSSISKQQSQDSKEEFRTSDQSNLKDNDFHKKKTSFNPLENVSKFIPIILSFLLLKT